MICFKQKIIFPSLLFLAAVLFLLGYTSCKNSAERDSHPEYFNKVFERTGTAQQHLKEKDLVYMDSAFAAFGHAGAKDKFQMYDRKRDFYFSQKRDYSKALLYTDSIIFICEARLDNQIFLVRYAAALFLKGDLYFALKNYDEGFHYYFLGKQTVINKIKDQCELKGYNGRIADVLFKQEKYRQAASYFLLDYKDRSNCETGFERFVYMQVNLDNAGESYTNAGMYDSAAYFFDSTVKFISKNEKEFITDSSFVSLAKAVVYGNKAHILDIQGKFADAEKLYQQSIARTITGDLGYAQSTLLKLADMYYRTGKFKEADQTLSQLKSSLDTIPTETIFVQWYKLKADYYDKQQQIVPAHFYLQKYLSVKDSIEARDKRFAAMDVSKEFENREQKAINETLKKDNELKTVYLLIAIITSLMSIAIILLVWYNLKRSKKHIRQLEELNLQVKQKNDDLQKTLVSLEQSHNENTRIMRIVAHDLKNPISAIQNLVYALLKKEQQASVKDILEVIKTACINSITLIKDLLTEKKHLSEIRKEMVDMSRLLAYCVELAQAKADEKNQRLLLQADHADIMLNRQKMWRVVSNIVNNAIKFSHENAEINIKLEKKETSVLLSVKDNGIGIPVHLKDKIFTIAPESSRIGTAGEESYGLGLSISQKIIEEHHGKIWFESTAGEGSIFYVELPLMN